MQYVFLVEEGSMKCVLETILPKLIPNTDSFIVIPHQGKMDLERSIPIKLKSWNSPDTRFVILRDKDQTDCKEVKAHLKKLCEGTGKEVLIRIPCEELESWYFGDLHAVSMAYNKDLTYLSRKKKYRIPDQIANPKQELHRYIPEHEQLSGARRISRFMNIDSNTSESFNFFVSGLRRFVFNATQ